MSRQSSPSSSLADPQEILATIRRRKSQAAVAIHAIVDEDVIYVPQLPKAGTSSNPILIDSEEEEESNQLIDIENNYGSSSDVEFTEMTTAAKILSIDNSSTKLDEYDDEDDDEYRKPSQASKARKRPRPRPHISPKMKLIREAQAIEQWIAAKQCDKDGDTIINEAEHNAWDDDAEMQTMSLAKSSSLTSMMQRSSEKESAVASIGNGDIVLQDDEQDKATTTKEETPRGRTDIVKLLERIACHEALLANPGPMLCKADEEQSTPVCWRLPILFGTLDDHWQIEYQGRCLLEELAKDDYDAIKQRRSNLIEGANGRYFLQDYKAAVDTFSNSLASQVIQGEEVVNIFPSRTEDRQSLPAPFYPLMGSLQLQEADWMPGSYPAMEHVPQGLCEASLQLHMSHTASLPRSPSPSDSVTLSCDDSSSGRRNSIESHSFSQL